jgi:hypothetical protein
MSKNIERWMSRPLLAGRQVVLVMVTLGSVTAWLLFWFGD